MILKKKTSSLMVFGCSLPVFLLKCLLVASFLRTAQGKYTIAIDKLFGQVDLAFSGEAKKLTFTFDPPNAAICKVSASGLPNQPGVILSGFKPTDDKDKSCDYIKIAWQLAPSNIFVYIGSEINPLFTGTNSATLTLEFPIEAQGGTPEKKGTAKLDPPQPNQLPINFPCLPALKGPSENPYFNLTWYVEPGLSICEAKIFLAEVQEYTTPPSTTPLSTSTATIIGKPSETTSNQPSTTQTSTTSTINSQSRNPVTKEPVSEPDDSEKMSWMIAAITLLVILCLAFACIGFLIFIIFHYRSVAKKAQAKKNAASKKDTQKTKTKTKKGSTTEKTRKSEAKTPPSSVTSEADTNSTSSTTSSANSATNSGYDK